MVDFFYECAGCKVAMPATAEEPSPPGVQFVVTRQGPKSETTFRCEACRVPDGETGA